jgi:cell division protein FtsW
LEEQQKIADKEYQSKEAEQAIQLGGLKGLGPGNSIKRNTLPNPYDDYIYSIIVEEWGLIVGSLVLFLYIWFLFRCVIIAQACKKPFAALSVIGLGCLITFQALIHIAVNIGAIPETGQTLPMISHGGTAYILMSAALGIILSINRTIEISKENEEKAKKALLWNNTETPEKSS